MKSEKELTRITFNLIEKDLLYQNAITDTGAVIDSLLERKNFKQLSDLLKDTLMQSERLKNEKKNDRASRSTFTAILFSLLSKQDGEVEAALLPCFYEHFHACMEVFQGFPYEKFFLKDLDGQVVMVKEAAKFLLTKKDSRLIESLEKEVSLLDDCYKLCLPSLNNQAPSERENLPLQVVFLKAVSYLLSLVPKPVMEEALSPNNFFQAQLEKTKKRMEEFLKLSKKKVLRNRNTVRRWFEEKTQSEEPQIETIRYREDAIAICFSLGLNYEASRDFMNKSGHAVFNIRKLEDAVYIYCFLKQRPLSAAKKLIHDYYAKVEFQTELEELPHFHTGDTTLLLLGIKDKTEIWETDEDFLNTYLLPNKENFISYSRTALKEYYAFKNPMYLTALREVIENEVQDYNDWLKKNKNKNKEEIGGSFITNKFRKNLKKQAPFSKLLLEASEDLKLEIERKNGETRTVNTSLQVVDFILSKLHEEEYKDEQGVISELLTDTLSADKVLSTFLPIYEEEETSKDSRQRAFIKELSNKEGTRLFTSFPHRHLFTKFERQPERYVHNMAIRKTLLLFMFIQYVHKKIDDIYEPQPSGEESYLYDFIEQTNLSLARCQLGSLYPANQFDFLILTCVKRLDHFSPEEEEEDYTGLSNPITFLNSVLENFFMDESEDF